MTHPNPSSPPQERLSDEGRFNRWMRRHWRKVVGGFVAVLLYVLYTGYAERLAWDIHILRREVEERRAEYLILRSDYLRATSEAAIRRRAKRMGLGLEPADRPPVRLYVPKTSER